MKVIQVTRETSYKIMFHVEQYIKLGSKNSHSRTTIIYEKVIVK